jgi:D-aminopeptidase
MAGLARTGSAFSNGSGDYAIAFSTADSVRRTAARRAESTAYPELGNEATTPLFIAAADATEEAIANSLLATETVTSREPGTDETRRAVALDRALIRRLLAAAGQPAP